MILTKEQNNVFRKILRNQDDHVQTLGGFGGTGKSTVLGFLAKDLPDFAICAYTGKAANVLRRRGLAAETIHSTIYHPVQEGGRVHWQLRHEVGFRGFLVDEASMVSKQIDRDLQSFGLPIIYIGDHGQLPPVGPDAGIMADPMYRLETVHRNAGPIAFFAEHLRKGERAYLFEGANKVQILRASRVPLELLSRVSQVICAFNRTRVQRNREIRRFLGYKELIEVGERVMCLRNFRDMGLYNGQQGIVTKIYPGNRLDFETDQYTIRKISFDPHIFGQEKPELDYDLSQPNPFDYAYCVTAHKAQGDEWRSVLVFEQHCQHWQHSRWAYTAASRARRRLYWAMNNPAWVCVPRRIGK
jgi:exodeoxyribonuclease-5